VKSLKNLNDLIEKMENDLKKLGEYDNVCLIHHDDGDGCSAAALFSILVSKLTGSFPILFPIRGPNNVNIKFANQIRDLNPDYVFSLDASVDPIKLSNFKGFILDHHLTDFKDYGGMSYVNPRSFEKDDRKVTPTSYMVYKLLKKMFSDEKASWVAGIGVTEDHRVEICKDLFEEIQKDFPDLLDVKEITQLNLEKSVFGRFWDIVRSGRMVRKTEGAKTAVLALIECKDRPDRFLNGLTQHSFALLRFYSKVAYETQYSLSEVRERGEFHKDKKVIFYENRPSRISALTSFIADKIRQEYPDYIVCVVGSEWGRESKKISVRLEQTKRNENLVEILEKVKEHVPTVKGGGHKSAIGVFVSPNYYKRFIKEFLAAV
jgi:single-stranded DNA-specific DHH superfamily exonuclease